MGHVVIRLAAGIGGTREFVLEKQKGRIRVSYMVATVSVGDAQVSMMQFQLNDLFTLIGELYGRKAADALEKTVKNPDVMKKLEEP